MGGGGGNELSVRRVKGGLQRRGWKLYELICSSLVKTNLMHALSIGLVLHKPLDELIAYARLLSRPEVSRVLAKDSPAIVHHDCSRGTNRKKSLDAL